MVIQEALTFDDVQILPNYSEVESRSSVSTVAHFTRNFWIRKPLIAAPMSTVCGVEMADALSVLGAVGAVHRFDSIEKSTKDILWLANKIHDLSIVNEHLEFIPIVGTVGATGDYQERAELLLKSGANVILVDVAHGDHIHVKRAINWLKQLGGKFDVIAGNVATSDGARRLEEWGADAVRVGIGGGSMCETRIRTGIGVPQFQAIVDVVEAPYPLSIPIISDGGIRYPGDVAKALAAGADTVMIGSMFAGTNESPGKVLYLSHTTPVKVFQGSASIAQKGSDYNVEGSSTLIPVKGKVEDVVRSIMEGVRSSMSYVGASNLDEFHSKARFIKITSNGLAEAHPHGVK